MKLVQEKSAYNQFSGYGVDWVGVNGNVWRKSMIVTLDALQPWRPSSFMELRREDFAVILPCQPELVLLGTGSHIRFPNPVLIRDLIDAHIGVETMDVGAVARTFNVLANEGRKVIALILFD